MLQQKETKEANVKARKKEKVAFLILILIQFIIQLIYWIRKWNSRQDKRFKIVPKGDKFQRDLPSSMADFTNLHFKNYISDKDIDEKMLTENPVPSNLQEVPALDDFVKPLLVSQTVFTTDHQMEKFQ